MYLNEWAPLEPSDSYENQTKLWGKFKGFYEKRGDVKTDVKSRNGQVTEKEAKSAKKQAKKQSSGQTTFMRGL